MTSTAALLLAADRERPRSLQRGIGISDLGSCRRRTGYKLAGTAPVNTTGSVQAVIGSAVHDAVARALTDRAEPGDLVEQEVTLAGIVGHLDRYESKTRCVVDVKTTSTRWLEHIHLHGPEHSHLWQVSCYAAALALKGTPVERIRIDYLCRDTGEEYQWPDEVGAVFTTRHVRDAFEWLSEVRSAVDSGSVDWLPRDYEPDSVFCQGCPFGGPDGGICWDGYVGERDMRSVLYVEDPDAARWAEELWQARRDADAAKKRAGRAKGALDAIRPDDGETVRCGDRYLRWTAAGLRFVPAPRKKAKR